jgi:hypothetical protein
MMWRAARRRHLDSYFELSDTTVNAFGRTFQLPSLYAAVLAIEQPDWRQYLLAEVAHFYLRTFIGMVDEYRDVYDHYVLTYPDDVRTHDILAQVIRDNEAESRQLNEPVLEEPAPPLPPPAYYPDWQPILLDDAGWIDSLTFRHKKLDLNQGTYYVDLWATWCGPCLKEMAHNAPLDSLLDARGVQRLYISLDGLSKREAWFETIHEYHLGGYHILASPALADDVLSRLGEGGPSIMIPRYFWWQDGQVVNRRAAAPSQFARILRELATLGLDGE